jgi:hypothetical protein
MGCAGLAGAVGGAVLGAAEAGGLVAGGGMTLVLREHAEGSNERIRTRIFKIAKCGMRNVECGLWIPDFALNTRTMSLKIRIPKSEIRNRRSAISRIGLPGHVINHGTGTPYCRSL